MGGGWYSCGMTKRSDVLTQRQEKLVRGIKENLSASKTKSMAQLAIEAGYSDGMSKQPSNILKSAAVQKRLQSLLATMDKAKRVHLAEMFNPDKVAAANVRDHAYVYDILIKNERLLSGESTENKAIAITINDALREKRENVPQKVA